MCYLNNYLSHESFPSHSLLFPFCFPLLPLSCCFIPGDDRTIYVKVRYMMQADNLWNEQEKKQPKTFCFMDPLKGRLQIFSKTGKPQVVLSILWQQYLRYVHLIYSHIAQTCLFSLFPFKPCCVLCTFLVYFLAYPCLQQQIWKQRHCYFHKTGTTAACLFVVSFFILFFPVLIVTYKTVHLCLEPVNIPYLFLSENCPLCHGPCQS